MARRIRAAASQERHPPTQSGCHPSAMAEEVLAVRASWATTGAHSAQSLARMTETVNRFASRLGAVGIDSFIDVTACEATGFITAPVAATGAQAEVATQHARRTAVRTLYRTLRALGYPVIDPTLDIALPPRGLLAARPLSDDEVTLCRASAQLTRGRWSSMRATAWALGEATAVSSEISAITVADLDDPHAPRCVELPGTTRHDPRIGLLSDWGRRVITARATALRNAGANSATLLAYGGNAPPGGAKAQASVCNALRVVLDAAGLAREPDVRPSSLRHWVGRTAYDSGTPIDAVARLLGHRSLDATAEDIALTWRTAPTPKTPTTHERH
jgi:integrase